MSVGTMPRQRLDRWHLAKIASGTTVELAWTDGIQWRRLLGDPRRTSYRPMPLAEPLPEGARILSLYPGERLEQVLP